MPIDVKFSTAGKQISAANNLVTDKKWIYSNNNSDSCQIYL